MARSKLTDIETLTFPHRALTLVTGCFDILHAGHVQLLEHAKLFDITNFVAVGLNSDVAISQLKGPRRPINTYAHRALVMAAIEYVDFVFEIDALRVDRVILNLAPLVWVKGGDYTMDTLDKGEVQAANNVGAKIALFRSEFEISTTRILAKSNEQTPS